MDKQALIEYLKYQIKDLSQLADMYGLMIQVGKATPRDTELLDETRGKIKAYRDVLDLDMLIPED